LICLPSISRTVDESEDIWALGLPEAGLLTVSVMGHLRMSSWPARTNQEAGWQVFIFVLLVDENERGTYLRVRHVSMTLSQLELALLGGLPLRKLDQLIARGHAPIYARPPSRRVACYTLHEAIMLVTGMLLHERYSLSWRHIHHAIALNPELFMDPLDEADGATGPEERWLAIYDEPRSAAVGRLSELPIPRATQRVFLVSLSEAIRRVRQRANGLGLVLPELGQWGTALEAYLAQNKGQRAYGAQPRAKAA
jgi:hypothetical protein